MGQTVDRRGYRPYLNLLVSSATPPGVYRATPPSSWCLASAFQWVSQVWGGGWTRFTSSLGKSRVRTILDPPLIPASTTKLPRPPRSTCSRKSLKALVQVVVYSRCPFIFFGLLGSIRSSVLEENKMYTGEKKMYTGENKMYTGENKMYTGENKMYTGENKMYTG